MSSSLTATPRPAEQLSLPLAVPLLRLPHNTARRPSRRSAMAVRACLAALVVAAARGATETFYVCNDVGDATFGGTYEIGDAFAGKPTWTNEFGKSLFAHGAWWYMGDLDAQPPVTSYRGVVDCAEDQDEPPTDCVYRASKDGAHPVPALSAKPCLGAPGEL